MSKLPQISLLILSASLVTYSSRLGYYWRDYTGKVPKDAIVAGVGRNGTAVYIGQAYVIHFGLIVVQIHPGTTQVQAVVKRGIMREINEYTKILCGDMKYIGWYSATSDNYHQLMKYKHPVMGGHQDSEGQLHIGKVTVNGESRIGSVKAFQPTVDFYYVDEWKSINVLQSFYVLTTRL